MLNETMANSNEVGQIVSELVVNLTFIRPKIHYFGLIQQKLASLGLENIHYVKLCCITVNY